ncbi:MAG TPA: hypothetical protein VJB36_08095, partial [Methylomirabilota bacterium]|nr:hypothetical protein [Methylomirabilota bacterium]
DAEGRTLWVAAHTGLYRSGGGGRAWQKVALAAKPDHLDVMAIAPHPTEALTLYVGTHEAGVLKSTDGGTTWKPAGTPKNLAAVAVSPKRTSEVYAATVDGQLLRSADGGMTWERQK